MDPVPKPMSEAVPAEDRPDVWAKWPDDFMCPRGEIEMWLLPTCARSDDYQLIEVLTYWYDGEPETWRPYAPSTETPAPDA